MRAAVLGASGYAGGELLRLMLDHPHLDVVFASADSAVGRAVGEHSPHLAGGYPNLHFSAHDAVEASDADVIFCALPHGVSQNFVAAARRRDIPVVDLGADFRLREPQHYEQWYNMVNTTPQLLSTAVYGLVERHREQIRGAALLAIPGCYPTASALALGPFVDHGWIGERGTIVNALSGTSGAGRALSDRLHFSRLDANAEAYGLLTHRHTIEMQQELGIEILFTPHLIPTSRGMLVTAYAPLQARRSTAEAMDLLHATYDHEPFVAVTETPPTLKDPLGSNMCFVSAVVDPRTGWLVAMSSLDNLVKGAAGQAVQAFNVAQEWTEIMGLPRVGVSP